MTFKMSDTRRQLKFLICVQIQTNLLVQVMHISRRTLDYRQTVRILRPLKFRPAILLYLTLKPRRGV